MLTSMEAFSNVIISYIIVLHIVGGLVSKMFTHPMLSFKFRMADYYALYNTVHYNLLYHIHCYLHEEFIYTLHRSIEKGQHRQYPHRSTPHANYYFVFFQRYPSFKIIFFNVEMHP
jgi:hypothetical protein